MPTLVVLFNLKAGVSVSEYENWARSTDLPIVNALPSVERFKIFRAGSVLGSTVAPPYQFVETIDLHDLTGLFNDISSPTMQKVASEFQAFADQPIFMVCNSIEER